MPTFEIETHDGKKFHVEADTPPTEQELAESAPEIFGNSPVSNPNATPISPWAKGLSQGASTFIDPLISKAQDISLGALNLPVTAFNLGATKGQDPNLVPPFIRRGKTLLPMPLINNPQSALSGGYNAAARGIMDLGGVENAALLPALAVPGIGETLLAAFLTSGASHLPEQLQQGVATIKDPNKTGAEKGEAGVNMALQPLLLALLAKGGLGERATPKSGLKPGDIKSQWTLDDLNRNTQMVPQERQLPLITPSTEQALINPAPKILGEGQGLGVRQMPERQQGQLQLPPIRGQWQVNELGEVIPAEQPELNKHVSREQSVRPAQASPTILGPKPGLAERIVPAVRIGDRVVLGKQGQTHADILKDNGIDPDSIPHVDPRRGFADPNEPGVLLNRQEAANKTGIVGKAQAGGLDSMDLPGASQAALLRQMGMTDEEISAELKPKTVEPEKAPPTIYQQYAAAGQPKQGGQISFAGEANKLPNRNPTAVEPAAPTLEGGEVKGLMHGLREKLDKVAAQRRQGGGIDMSIFEDVVEYGKKLFNKGKDFATWSKLMSDDLGGNVAPYLKDAFDHVSRVVGSRPNDRPFLMAAGELVAQPNKLKIGLDKEGKYTAQQAVARLRNSLGESSSEWQILKEQGIEQKFASGKVSPEEMRTWVDENGPRVEVKELKASDEPSVSERERIQAQTLHELETRGVELDVDGMLRTTTGQDVLELPEFSELANRYYDTVEPTHPMGRPAGVTESATARYTMVNPKPLDKMPGAVDLLVRVPLPKEIKVKQTAPNNWLVEGPDITSNFYDEVAAHKFAETWTKEVQAGRYKPAKFTSSHYPTEGKNLVAHVRGYMETTPEGKKVFRVFEVQSDWAQIHREQQAAIKARANEGMDTRFEKDISDPLLAHYERLALKAAIEHAREQGADAIAVDDAETAMLTEGHDTQLARGGSLNVDIRQEKGMRLHYDQTLPKIARELTGDEGKVVDFGEHQNAIKGYKNTDLEGNPWDRDRVLDPTQMRLVSEPRPDLIFRNADGSPKTTSTGRLYSLEKVKASRETQPATLLGKDKPVLPPMKESVQSRISSKTSESGGPDFTTAIVDTMERFKATLDTLKDTYLRRTSTSDVAARRDAVDTLTLRAQTQAENHIELAAKRIFPNNDKVARNAVFAMLESSKTGGLASALSKVAGKHSDAEAAVKFAMDPKNLKGMNDLVKEVKDLDAQNIALAKSEGISIQPLADYLKHMYEQEARPFFFRESRSMGTGKGSMAARKFPSIFDAINAGYKPLSLDAMALVGKRTQEIYLQVQTKRWLDGYRTVLDPVSKEAVVKDLGKLGLPPEGYVKVEGLGLAVKEGYQNIFRAVTGESRIAESKVGQAALEAEGGIKHGTLAFDVFHLSRIAQFARSVDLGVGYKKGLSLLEYSAKDLDEAIKQGKAPADAKTYQNEVVDVPQGKFTRRQIGSLNVQNGLNVGKHSEALYTAFVRSFPGLKQTVGRFNRYVFDKVSRGALYEAAQVEFQRIANDNPTKSANEVARQVSRDLNIRFGNLGRQGVVKSKTMQDITQLIFLAPRWVEAMAQSEGRSMGQVGKSLVTGKMGTLGKSSAKLLATYFVATQAVNYIFNGHTTFQNDNNKGHEIDAYIPPITKDGKGFWISPLSVVAELTHDVLRYSRGSEGPLDKRLVDAGARIVGNKLSPLAQGAKTAITGRNWKNEPVEGWNRVKEALITGVNPTPLPLRQAATAVKENDIAPLERQAFSMAGIKAEPESFGDVKQRKIQALGKATLQQRAQLEKDVKGLRPTSTDQSMLAAAERKIAANLERRDALLERLPSDMQGWLKTNGLHIHGFSPELAFNGTKISLTKQESKFYEDKIVEGYEKFIGPWVGKTVNQKRLDERIDQSRMWAKNQLRVAMQNGSIYEKKEPTKRFSIFSP